MRQEIERRPLLLAAGGLILGLSLVDHPWNLLFVGAALVILRQLSSRLWFACALVPGLLLAPSREPPILDHEMLREELFVKTVPRLLSDHTSFQAADSRRSWSVSMPGDPHLSMGDRISIHALARPLNVGARPSLALHGIAGSIWLAPGSWSITSRGPWLFQAANTWRRSFREFSQSLLSPEQAMETEALLFGDPGLLSSSRRDSMQQAGLMHLVSASGFHVLIFASAMLAIFSVFPIPRGLQLFCIGAVLVLYALATGLHPSVIRSSLMAIVALSAYRWRREPDWLSALAVSAIACLLWQPASVYELGFQLSFVVVLALGFFARPLRSERSWRQTLQNSFRFSLVAWLASAPLLAYHLGEVSLATVPAALLASAAMPFVLIVALAAHLFHGVCPSVAAGAITMLLSPALSLINGVSSGLSVQWALIELPAFEAYWLALIYGAAALCWRRRVCLP